MKFIVTEGIAHFGTGLALHLTPEQVAPRKRYLAQVKRDGELVDGLYVPTQPIQFKVGEELEIECKRTADLPRGLAAVLTPASRAGKKIAGAGA